MRLIYWILVILFYVKCFVDLCIGKPPLLGPEVISFKILKCFSCVLLNKIYSAFENIVEFTK